jgi:hypothetical protein
VKPSFAAAAKRSGNGYSPYIVVRFAANRNMKVLGKNIAIRNTHPLPATLGRSILRVFCDRCRIVNLSRVLAIHSMLSCTYEMELSGSTITVPGY